MKYYSINLLLPWGSTGHTECDSEYSSIGNGVVNWEWLGVKIKWDPQPIDSIDQYLYLFLLHWIQGWLFGENGQIGGSRALWNGIDQREWEWELIRPFRRGRWNKGEKENDGGNQRNIALRRRRKQREDDLIHFWENSNDGVILPIWVHWVPFTNELYINGR